MLKANAETASLASSQAIFVSHIVVGFGSTRALADVSAGKSGIGIIFIGR